MLPQVEVRRDRVTVLDVKIAEQERAIAAEKVNTRPTELDKALNDSKVTKALSFLGGESAQQRATVANERVHLMEAEKDILEAMKVARTKDEKQELQKQLDEIRAMRRELESALR
jgi:small-conductance mechanosensitive channel